jgi:hypothetical protein
VYGLTEYTFNEMTFRAHPCYKNDTPWFDWVMIAWNIPIIINQSKRKDEDSPDYVELPNTGPNADKTCNTAMLIPAKLICIIKDELDETFAIVHSCLQH